MKASKKQIESVLAVDSTLTYSEVAEFFTHCSLTIFKSIGPEGIVRSMAAAKKAINAAKEGMILLSEMIIEHETEKAYLCKNIFTGGHAKTFLVAKSLVVDGKFPAWIANK